ncbi:hypothetical protein [Lewinella sp. IMCC34183]|uniref:hypothetical protein n=1 Tax=Lewinella sp. IMCC34183 TaxID=2248762 RepID=UPI0013007B7D|nr:hypothetical protein [Lewinella sp. IMCC34183]
MKLIFSLLCFVLVSSCGGVSDNIESLGDGLFFIFEGGNFNQLVVGREDDVGVVLDSVLLSGVKEIDRIDDFIYAKANGMIDTNSVKSFVSQYDKPVELFEYELGSQGTWCGDCWFIIDVKSHITYGPLSQATTNTLNN